MRYPQARFALGSHDAEAVEQAVWNQQVGQGGPQMDGWLYADGELWVSVDALEEFRLRQMAIEWRQRESIAVVG